MAMAPILYIIDVSPPCRTVLLAAKALGIALEIKTVNLFEKEHYEPSFLKMNPAHKVPVLNDNGLIIVDSHAIITYLAQKYGKDNSLYPKDLKQRILVDQRLYFEAGSVFFVLYQSVLPIYLGAKTVRDEDKESIRSMYKVVETYLTDKKWIAGETLTLADLSFITSITSSNLVVPIPEKEHPNIIAWIKRCASLPYYGENQRRLDEHKALFQKLMS